eukprot:jgi/Chlat1/1044/Chrsp110S01555
MAAVPNATYAPRKVESGYGAPEADLPIDVHYNKLAAWLVDRGKCPADYRKVLAAVKARAAAALKSLPQDVDASLRNLPEDELDYSASVRIRDAVAPRDENKGLLARLTKQTPEWEAIVRAYEKDNILLAEAAQILTQNVDYEVPFLRKQASRAQQQLVDLDRREAELRRGAAASAHKYKQACEELGIAGKDLKGELRALAKQLPAALQEAVACMRQEAVGSACALYSTYTLRHHTPREGSAAELLPALAEVRASNDEPSAEMPVLNFAALQSEPTSTAEPEAPPLVINWDAAADPQQDSGTPPTISWDVDVSDTSTLPPAINWDIDVAAEPADGVIVDAEPPAIDWNIEVTDEAAEPTINWDIDVPDAGTEVHAEDAHASEVGVETDSTPRTSMTDGSKPSTAERLMATDFRNQLLNDLLELQAFLRVRKVEVQFGGMQSLLRTAYAEDSQGIHESDKPLEAMEAAVAAATKALLARRTRELTLIHTSPRYVERLLAVLKSKASQSFRLQDGLADVDVRRREVRSQLAKIHPNLQALITRMRDLKLMAENRVSALYSNRPVNIIGEINNVLQ